MNPGGDESQEGREVSFGHKPIRCPRTSQGSKALKTTTGLLVQRPEGNGRSNAERLLRRGNP